MRADGWIAALLALAIAGCATRAEGPRPIAVGTPCAQCGMRVEDLRFACEQERLGAYRVYDSIECLLQADALSDHTWLADHDRRTLHAAESVWVVRADIPSPMGGGYVAFVDRGAADEVADARRGRVERWSTWAADSARSGAEGRQP